MPKPGSAETTSTVFRWEVIPPVVNGSSVSEAGPPGNGSNVSEAGNGSNAEEMAPTEEWEFVAYQEIPTHDARKVRD